VTYPSQSVPNGWEVTRLGDVLASIDAGVSPQALARPAQQNELGVLKVSAVTWNEFRPFENKALTEDFDATDCPRVQRGDLLLSRANTVELIAAPVIADNDYPNLLLSDKTLRLVPKSNIGYAPYLLRVLRTKAARQYSESHATGTSGSMRNVSQETIRGCPIMLPPLPEQRRIADILDRAESLRSKRRAAIARLDELTQEFFFDTFGDPVANPYGFSMSPLESVVSLPFQNGAYFPKEAYSGEDGTEMVHMSDAFEGIVRRGDLKRVRCTCADIEKHGLSESDILVARRSLNYEGSVKPCQIPRSDQPLLFESSLIRLTPDTSVVSQHYLFHYLSNERVRQRFVFPYVTRSTISGINQENLARVPVMLAPKKLQSDFSRRIAALDKLKSTHRASLSELDALFGSLQHRAFRGEL